jgi:hypothetical protein
MREMIEMLYEFEEPFVVDHSKFEQAFGEQATPLKEAIGETVRWYRSKRPARDICPALRRCILGSWHSIRRGDCAAVTLLLRLREAARRSQAA